MKKLLILVAIIFSAFMTSAQSTITLYDLVNAKGSLQITNPINIGKGISDNAVFHPTAPFIFFIQRSGNLFQLVRKNYETGADTIIHESKDPIRSLEKYPDNKFISFIRSIGETSSDLVLISVEGGTIQVKDQRIDFENYAWVDDNSLVVIVPGNPNTLRLRSIRPRHEKLIAQNVATDLYRFSDTPSVTFIHQQSFDFSTFKRINEKDGRIEVIIDAAPEQTIFSWTPAKVLLSCLEGKIISFDPAKDKDWTPVKMDLSVNVKFMAISPAGNKIVLVY